MGVARLIASGFLAFEIGIAGFVYPAISQTYPVFREPTVASIDQERLFSESNFGKQILQEIETVSRALSLENREIEAKLTAEEKSLAELRKTELPEIFKQKAAEFDRRVKQIRAEQDQKFANIRTTLDTARQTFNTKATPILQQLMVDSGIVFILDSSAILMGQPNGDITDQAIARIDQELEQ
ncbi:hypothetical protein GCM10008927_03480 [Amylibacter ulvae]|uniref:OmpH family outer membrane protein n=1 Tax=Paramylibacter ulvae TaxID=1651968 RepID=A0ABQ3CSV8_9RHOB|nr:OmpH family outer membrane protein [Amylibacter ulvae]GHA42323.1 hypothetical protein GCM10008927_03480 [Amylibacter ulvae]